LLGVDFHATKRVRPTPWPNAQWEPDTPLKSPATHRNRGI